MTPRGNFALANNIFGRILDDPEARSFFESKGLPVSPQLMSLRRDAGPYDATFEVAFLSSPLYAAEREWIADNGFRVYALWLLRDPIAHADVFIADIWEVLAARSLGFYMPTGWSSESVVPFGNPTRSELVMLVLIIASPLMLRRPRTHPLTGVAVLLLAGGTAAALASYFGDAIEIPRHCYGAGQLIVLGLFLGVVGYVDGCSIDYAGKANALAGRLAGARVRLPRPASHATPSR